MKHSRLRAWVAVAFLIALPLAAKDEKEVSNVFDAPPDKVYEAVYKYAQHHGMIQPRYPGEWPQDRLGPTSKPFLHQQSDSQYIPSIQSYHYAEGNLVP